MSNGSSNRGLKIGSDSLQQGEENVSNDAVASPHNKTEKMERLTNILILQTV